MQTNVMGRSLFDLRPLNVPYRHSFEVSAKNPVYQLPLDMALKHNQIVKNMDKMLDPGVTTPKTAAIHLLLL